MFSFIAFSYDGGWLSWFVECWILEELGGIEEEMTEEFQS
jgi:hypothetical protein